MIFVFLYRYLFLLRQIYICVGLSGIPAATVVEAANEVALQGGSSKELPLNINLGGKKINITPPQIFTSKELPLNNLYLSSIWSILLEWFYMHLSFIVVISSTIMVGILMVT